MPKSKKRARSPDGQVGTSSDDDDASQNSTATDPVAPAAAIISKESLTKLNVSDLHLMAKKIHCDEASKPNPQTKRPYKKAELIDLIIAHNDKNKNDKNKVQTTSVSKNGHAQSDVKIWLRHLEVFCGKLEVPTNLTWASGRILMCPPLWIVIFWTLPPCESEIYEALGTEGPLLRSLRVRWRQLTGALEDDIDELVDHFVNLYQLVTAMHLKMTSSADPDTIIESWVQRTWKMHIGPALKKCRQLQADRVRSKGLADLARRMEARAEIPLEDFSADMSSMVFKALTDSRGFGDTRALPVGNVGGGRGGGGDVKKAFKCWGCKKLINIPKDTSRADAIREHRGVCAKSKRR